jgi:hypothetical protein
MQEHHIEIKYQKDTDSYTILLGVTSLDFLRRQAERDEVRKLEGEFLAKALVMAGQGNIRWVSRMKNQLPNDGPDGEPAIVRFSAAGVLFKEEHAQNGLYHDSIHGDPAQKEFDPATGVLLCVTRCKDGVINDGAKGEPAFEQYSRGRLIETRRYQNGIVNDSPAGEAAEMLYASGGEVYHIRHKNGKRNDGPNGEPAWQVFDRDGNLLGAERYKDGKKTGALADEEFKAYSGELTRRKVETVHAAWGDRLKVAPPAVAAR